MAIIWLYHPGLACIIVGEILDDLNSVLSSELAFSYNILYWWEGGDCFGGEVGTNGGGGYLVPLCL